MTDITLKLREHRPADAERAYVPCDHYDIVLKGKAIGTIDLRHGDTEELKLYGGQVGYKIDPDYQGHGYAAQALRTIASIAVAAGISELWITCSPENIASCKTAENAGAIYVETLSLPETSDMYARGERFKKRYLFHLE